MAYFLHLDRIAKNMRIAPTEDDRKGRLMSGVRAELQAEECRREEIDPDCTYSDLLAHYQSLESDIRFFKKVQHGSKPEHFKPERSEKPTYRAKRRYSKTRDSDEKAQERAGIKRKKDRKNPPLCEHCNKRGHRKNTCWSLHGKPGE